MEVWALEAHGASNLLREMVTVKSDDIRGRSKIFQDIVDGRPLSKPNVPEGFNVLIRTIRSLGLDIDAKKEDGTSIYEKKDLKGEVIGGRFRRIKNISIMLGSPEKIKGWSFGK